MPSPTVTLNENTILTALRSFLLACVPSGVEVFQSQNNKVAEPAGLDFIIMTPAMRQRMSTNNDAWTMTDPAADHIDRSHSTAFTVQLDIHGPNGSDYAQIIATLFRDEYGCEAMQAAGLAPLFATDGTQAPFRNAEQQYENRWVMKVTIGASPIVSTPQEFAATLAATLRPVI